MNAPRTHTPLKQTYVDLHIHSTASDGSVSPLEIIQIAEKAGLGAIAITDHDTLEGSAEALRYQQGYEVEILPGIEISAPFRSGTMHILGYLIRLDDVPLREALEVVQRSRATRNLQILAKLQNLGFEVTYDEVFQVAGEGQIGRPHIAQALLRKRVVQSIEEAFVRFLKQGGPAYADRYRLEPAEAIQTILHAGGVPVLAHPSSLHTENESDLETVVAGLKELGLKGIEAYCTGHGFARTAQYKRLAHRQGLLVTGGTDFHGAIKPAVHIGVGNGDLRVPYTVVEELKRAATSSYRGKAY